MKIIIALLAVSLLVGCAGEVTTIEADPQPRPPSGVYDKRLGGEEGVAPLEIQTQAGADYYVKLEDIHNRDRTMTMYIHGGNTMNVEVPLGSYLIKYTSGDTWYGEKDDVYFGENNFYQAAETFTFTDTGNQISGYTITLYQVVDGNLRTNPIGKEQF